MPGLMIIAHAPLASSLKPVAEHTLSGLRRAARGARRRRRTRRSRKSRRRPARCSPRVRSPEALIFTDVFGATPCNVAQRLADGVQVQVVAGVNVPMLWRSLCYADEPLDARGGARGGRRDAGRDAGRHHPAAEPDRQAGRT